MNLFTDKPLPSKEDNMFTATPEAYVPPIVPQEKALQRVAPLVVDKPDELVPQSLETMSEANMHNTQSTEEIEIIIKDEQARLDAVGQAASEAMMDNPSTETVDAYIEIQDQLKAANVYDLRENAARKEIFTGDGNKPVATAQEDFTVWLELNKFIAQVQAGLEEDLQEPNTFRKWASLGTAYLGMLLPQHYTGRIAAMAKEFNPEGYFLEHGVMTGAVVNAHYGTNRRLIVDKLLEAPMEDRVELILQLADVVKNSRSGLFYDQLTQYFTNDGVNKKVAFDDIINELKEGRVDGIDWDLLFGNTIGVFDSLPLFLKAAGSTIKGVTKGAPQPKPQLLLPPSSGPKLLTGTVDDIVEATPKIYTNALQDSFKGSTATSFADQMYHNPEFIAKVLGSESAQIAEAMGLRVEDVVGKVAAKPEGFNSTGMSSAAFDALDGQLVRLNKILNTINPKFALTTNEVEVAVNLQVAASIKNMTSSKLVPDGTKIAFNKDGFDVASVFGKESGRGYANLAEARTAGLAYGGNIEDVDIIHWNQQTGQYDKVKAEFIKKTGPHDYYPGDFFIATKEQYFYTDQTVMKLDHPNFDGKRPTRVPDTASKILGKMAGQQFILPDTITLSASVAVDKEAALTKQSSIATKVFLKASNSSKRRVQQALDDGNREAVHYTKEQFMLRYEATPRDFDIYANMRVFYDALHSYRGTTLSKQFKAKGYRFITVSPETTGSAVVPAPGVVPTTSTPDPVHFLGVPVDKAPSHIKRVWDPTKQKSVKVSESDRIYRLDQPEFFGGTWYSHINVGKSGKVTGLPTNVLKYEPGYVEIHYADPYTAYKVYDRSVDGVKERFKKVVGTFQGKKEANAAIDAQESVAINAGESRGVYTVERRGPQTFSATGDVGEYTKWYQKREDRLQRGLFGENGATPMVSVIESLERTMKGFAKTAAVGPWMDLAKQRYVNTFGKDLIVPDQYSPPNLELLRDTKQAGLAQNMYDYLELMGGLHADDTNLLTSAYRTGILALGEFMETPFPAMGKGLQNNVADWSPTDFMRGAAFSMLVPTHPLRQLIQNPLTALWLSSLDPVAGSAAMIDAVGMIGGLATRKLGGAVHDKAMWGYAKSLGTDVPTAKRLMEEFLNSGLVSELDARLVYQSGILNASNEVEGVAKRVTAAPARAVMGLVKGAKRAGFDAGEVALMTQAVNFALRNHIRTTGKSIKEILGSQSDLDTIFGAARQLAGNQNRAGTSWIQQKEPVIFNLLSFGMSQTLAQWFDSAASSTFKKLGAGGKKKTDFLRSQPNQVKWLMGGLFLYGGASYQPLIDAYESQFGPIPEDIKNVLFLNAVDKGFNGFIELVSGEKSEVNWTESINPAFFLPALEQMRRTFFGRKAADFYFGATGGAKRRVDTMATALGWLTIDDTVPTTAKILKGADIIMEGLSKGWFDAKFVDAYIRQQAHFTDKYGNSIGDVTLGNTIGKVLGMSLYGEAAARRSRYNEKQNKEDYKSIQQGLFLYMNRMGAGEEGWSTGTQERIEGLIDSFEHWDEVERRSFNEGMASRLGWSFQNNDQIESSFSKWMGKNTRESRNNMRYRIENDPTLTDHFKSEMNLWLERTKGTE